MLFKYPELLFALFLLLIPIFIHLFQLRRFQKIDFTNVAFLKKASLQTRKSSRLKKWLTLIARLLALTSIIFAFAQPYTASESALALEKEVVIYLDNSYSMQAKGAHGPLLQRTLQDLYAQANGTEKISWFTNDFVKGNVSIQGFKSDILAVSYSAAQLTPAEVLLKANQLFSKSATTEKRLIYLSDFQVKGPFPKISENLIVDAVQLKPNTLTNVAIDTAYVVSKTAEIIQLKVALSTYGASPSNIAISLFGNDKLIAKSGVDYSENSTNEVRFDIENTTNFSGQFMLEESNMPFDNSLYFSINSPTKIKVLTVYQGNTNYLQRLFDQSEFEYTEQLFNNLNYDIIPNQNFIILHELENITTPLATALQAFSEQGGSVLLIPSDRSNILEYNSLMESLGLGQFSIFQEVEKNITQIVFDHPLYTNVFEKRVVNFQYPMVRSYFDIASKATPILKFDDGKPFLLQAGNSFVSSAPFNIENSNFQNSPLIVPTIYNMAQLSLPLTKLYYTIGNLNNFSVPVQLQQDEILTIKDSTYQFIPLQQTKSNQVDISTRDEPSKAGSFQIAEKDRFLEYISYNYSRDESAPIYANPDDWEGITRYSDLDELFTKSAEASSMSYYWKWFVIFALIFLVFEMLILKFYK